MNTAHTNLLKQLIEHRNVAALGTLHDDKPLVSMVPFALFRQEGLEGFLIHVSQLSAHTRDMMKNSDVSLMIMQNESEAETPLALARLSIACTARQVPHNSDAVSLISEAYISKLTDAAPLLGFGDFTFFHLQPVSARFVAGFAQAMNISAKELAQMIRHEN